jgi:hypothetical protein
MSTITVRIPDDLRKRMGRVKGVNWSEVIRRAILERVMVEEEIGSKSWDLVRRAAEDADRLRMRLEAMYGKCNYDSTETIRSWRDARTWRGES